MNSEESLSFSKVAIQGTAWRYVSFFSGKLMIFISTAVLARVLSKDDFGVVGFAVTAINFLDVMSSLGIFSALIYYPEDDKTSSTAFWLGMILAISLFLITWFAAPLVGLFFQDPRAIPVTRILAISYPLTALGSTQEVLLYKRLAFGRNILPNIASSVTKGLISIAMAFLGYGVWSQVGGQLGGIAVGAVLFWFVTQWKPSFVFDFNAARLLLSYGLQIVAVGLLGIFIMNVDYLLVGRYLGAVSLGVYTLAFRVPDLLTLQFARILSGVLFPLYTRMRDEPGSMAKGFVMTTRYISLLSVPIALGLALLAEPFVLVVFTDKWAEAIPVVRAISIYAMLVSFTYNAGSVYKAEGRPNLLTILGVLRLSMLLPALYWAVTGPRSIVMVGWMHVLVAFIGAIVNIIFASRMIKLSIFTILDSLRPSLVAGAIMSIAIFAVLYLVQNQTAMLQLVIGIAVGALAYLGSLWLFDRKIILDVSVQLNSAFRKA